MNKFSERSRYLLHKASTCSIVLNMKIDIHKYSGREYLSKKAGEFFDPAIPPRTIQSWSEKGLIKPHGDTTGTGKRRLYNFVNLIEIGVIKSLTAERLKLDTIKKVLDFLRSQGGYVQTIAEEQFKGNDVVFNWPEGEVNWEESTAGPSFKKAFERERNYSNLEGLLTRDEGYLIIHLIGDPPTSDIRTFRIDVDQKRDRATCIFGVNMLTNPHAEKTITINITKIVNNVIEALE